jgi:molybdate transport system substrate-binding protein
MRRRSLPLALLTASVLLAACGDDGSAADTLRGSSKVLAAQSLSGALGGIEEAFEREHPDVDLQISFDGSAKLAAAIVEGAPADLFAAADGESLDEVRAGHRTSGDPVVFAESSLQIVVAKGNPKGIETLADLTRADLKLSLCGPEVPCGRYARQAFAKAGLQTPAAGDQDNVKGVLSQVQLGEADAGIVYVTDVLAAGDGVEGIGLDARAQVVASYPASVLAEAANPEVAGAFLAFLTSKDAQDILVQHGFVLP